jgi:hypothetical protein
MAERLIFGFPVIEYHVFDLLLKRPVDANALPTGQED